MASVLGEDTMTGDGGEYLRAEDLRELGDDSLPGHYLDGFSYMSHNLDRSQSRVHLTSAKMHTNTQKKCASFFPQDATHPHSPKLPSERRSPH